MKRILFLPRLHHLSSTWGRELTQRPSGGTSRESHFQWDVRCSRGTVWPSSENRRWRLPRLGKLRLSSTPSCWKIFSYDDCIDAKNVLDYFRAIVSAWMIRNSSRYSWGLYQVISYFLFWIIVVSWLISRTIAMFMASGCNLWITIFHLWVLTLHIRNVG